jgi:uncharacterized small protein (DUF1192 family)
MADRADEKEVVNADEYAALLQDNERLKAWQRDAVDLLVKWNEVGNAITRGKQLRIGSSFVEQSLVAAIEYRNRIAILESSIAELKDALAAAGAKDSK